MVLIAICLTLLLLTATVSLYSGFVFLTRHHMSHYSWLAVGLLLLIAIVEISLLLRLRMSVAIRASYWNKLALTDTGQLTYVALGDSAAQGIGASKASLGYVALVAKTIEQSSGKSVRVINISQSGAKLQDVIHDQLPQLQKLHPNIITVDIGANDIADGTPTVQMLAEYQQITTSLAGYKVVFASLPDFMWGTQQAETLKLNKTIKLLCEQSGLQYADLYTATHAKMWSWNEFAADGFHPSNAGHLTWASSFKPGVEKILSKS
ncbi:MAG: SGNH/GDSL hydrolase family protein [Patescibacteria group bacterium]|nr:SGNH/GDSL hydrolase family protein [Patescibacteria group bacterium]